MIKNSRDQVNPLALADEHLSDEYSSLFREEASSIPINQFHHSIEIRSNDDIGQSPVHVGGFGRAVGGKIA
jgi:hypothetical protein